MISGDNPLVAFLPTRYHREFQEVLHDLRFGDTSSLSGVKKYCSELHRLLQVSSAEATVLSQVVAFLQTLLDQVKDMFKGNITEN